MAAIRRRDLENEQYHPDLQKPKEPDYYYTYYRSRFPGYYNHGLVTYDVMVNGEYYGSVQTAPNPTRRKLIERALYLYKRLKNVQRRMIEFRFFGSCILCANPPITTSELQRLSADNKKSTFATFK